MTKIAYPHQMSIDFPFRRVDLKRWKDTRLKIKAGQKVYITYSQDQIIDAYIGKWDKKEQQMFKEWFSRLDDEKTNKKYAGTKIMEKVSYEFIKDKLQSLEMLKKKLRSRIHSVEMLLNKLSDSNLLGSGGEAQQKVTLLSRILQRLKEEVNVLHSPVLLEARQRRAMQLFKWAGIDEGVDILNDTIRLTAAFTKSSLVKTAQQHFEPHSERDRLQDVLNIIGSEINSVSYKTHLKNMYKALQILENIGRSSDVDIIARVIRDDLPDLEKMNKRLMEVYTNLSQQRAETEIETKLR